MLPLEEAPYPIPSAPHPRPRLLQELAPLQGCGSSHGLYNKQYNTTVVTNDNCLKPATCYANTGFGGAGCPIDRRLARRRTIAFV